MIKKRSRPQPRIRESSPGSAEDLTGEQGGDEEDGLPIAELLELRRLRKARQGIDAAKLTKGDAKRKKPEVEEMQGGLRQVARVNDEEDDLEESKEAKARRVVRSNNFTQQTNALDVDKHMMAYIEENLKIRNKPREEDKKAIRPLDPQEELYQISDRWKVDKKTADEGNVTNSMAMLTAIPEVDLGMDTRLKNIEDTEKAKRVVAEERQERKRTNNDEEHLVASRFYRPNLRQKSDAELLRDAKMEAMGIVPLDDQLRKPHHERTQMATDEMVMERFKKRMRK